MCRPLPQFLNYFSLCSAMLCFFLAPNQVHANNLNSALSNPNPNELHEYISRVGIHGLANNLPAIRAKLREALPAEAQRISRTVLSESANALHESNPIGDAEKRWLELLNNFESLRLIHSGLEPYLGISESLTWIEEQQRFLEREMNSEPEAAKKFILETRPTLDVLWLRIRFDRLALKDPSTEILRQMREIPIGPSVAMDRLLRMRIAAHAAADLYTRKSAIAAYCSALTRLGLGREADIDSAEKISWNELVTSGPGCIRLRPKDTNSSRIVQVISDQSFTMAFDSVVLAQGINISVSARSFDGSLFDLSTPEADAESIPGPAGSLTVDVRNAQDSYLPAFVSVGMESTNSLNPEPDNETNLSRVDGLFSFLIAGEIRRIRNGRESL